MIDHYTFQVKIIISDVSCQGCSGKARNRFQVSKEYLEVNDE
jgi:hypothetical protein